jgi:hypothetical protein
MVAFVIMALIGSVFLLFGFIVWRFKIAGVVAGYDSTLVKDPDGLAHWMGKCIMGMGLLAWVVGGVGLLFSGKNADTMVFVAFMVLFMISIAIALAGTQQYNK